MKAKTLLLLIGLFAFTAAFSQSQLNLKNFHGAHSSLLDLSTKNKNIVTEPQAKKQSLLLFKNKRDKSGDIFTQLINWDCRIKIRLNSSFQFILTYS